MEPLVLAIISIPVLLLLLALGVPVAVALGVIGLVGLSIISGPSIAMAKLLMLPYSVVSNYLWIVVPLFILLGIFASEAGISRQLFDIGRKWTGRSPGGLAIATILASAAFGAACGSSVACAAVMGKMAIPEMESHGYDRKLAAGCVAAGGTLAIMIPPSTLFVLYGVMTQTSIGGLLVAGIIPGLIMTAIYSIGLLCLSLLRPGTMPAAESSTWRERFISLKGAWRLIVIFLIVVGGIYFGIGTAEETAAAGALVAFLMLVISRKSGVGSKLVRAFTETVSVTCMLFIIFVGAGLYGFFITVAGMPAAFAKFVADLGLSPMATVLLFAAVYIPLGMFLDGFSILVITMPIMFPVVVNQLGFSPIWFGVLVCLLIEIALITPPVALNVYTIAGVAPHIPMWDIFIGASWFVLFDAIAFFLLFFFPVLSLLLPSLMVKPGG